MNSPDPNPDLATALPQTVVCVGKTLLANLEYSIPPCHYPTALVIFLGNYYDHGLDTQCIIDFLLSLASAYPHQTQVFLTGYHNFTFTVLGSVEAFREEWKAYGPCEESEGWYRAKGYEDMHLQGRRWGGKMKDRFNKAKGKEFKGSIFNAALTFESYGVTHGSAATPDGIKHCRLIAVHAWLERGKDVREQLRSLQAKDTRIAKIQAIAGRKNVWDIPEELIETPTIVVSGHHGKLHIQGLGLRIDEGNGSPDKPAAAVVLPSLKITRDTDFLPTE